MTIQSVTFDFSLRETDLVNVTVIVQSVVLCLTHVLRRKLLLTFDKIIVAQ